MYLNIEILGCKNKCSFFGSDMDGMFCGHPFFKDKGYENRIINHDNSENGKTPDQCPLKKEDLVINYSLKK